VGNRPFIRFAAVPRDLSPFMRFKGSFYLEGTAPVSIHILFCTTDKDNYQDEIRLEPGTWVDVEIFLEDMLDMGKPNWGDITGVVFTIGGDGKNAKVYMDDMVLFKTTDDPKDGKGGDKGK
jgi:hypothetical protein